MSKAINAAIIDGLAKELEATDSCVVVGTVGMTVAEVAGFRARLRSHSVRVRVIKNTLAERSFEKRGFNGLGAVLKGPSAVIYGGEGAMAISKLLVDEKKKVKEKLLIHGAFSEGEVLDAKGVDVLSKAPSRKELLAETLGAIAGPISGMAQMLDGLFTETHGLIEALIKKRETETAA